MGYHDSKSLKKIRKIQHFQGICIILFFNVTKEKNSCHMMKVNARI